jgi:hypothetical protein
MRQQRLLLVTRCGLTFGILLVVATTLCRAAGQNLVQNGDFEAGRDGWQWPQGKAGKAEIVPGPKGSCVRIRSTSSNASTYVTQSLDPQRIRGRRVRVEATLKAEKVAMGEFHYSQAKLILICNDGQKDHYLERDFSGTFAWKRVSEPWLIPDNCQKATLYLGLHTTTGTVWYDEVRVTVPTLQSERTLGGGIQERVYDDGVFLHVDGREFTQQESDQAGGDFQPTAAEQEKGLVLFQTEEPSEVVPGRMPRREEVLGDAETLQLLAAPDQYEPIAFAALALRPMKRVSVKVPELVGPNGAVIRPTAFDVRRGRSVIQRVDYKTLEYHRVPKLLEKAREVPLVPQCPQLFWLTLHVPADAVPGEYAGRIAVHAEEQVVWLPVRLRVLPFQLAANKPWMLFFYNSNPAEAERYFRDMREHGMTSVILAQVNAPLRREGERVTTDFATSDAFVEAYRKAGFREPLVYNPFHDRLATRLLELFGQADKYPKVVNYGEEICVFKEGAYPAALQDVYRQVVRELYDHARQANWPPMLYYPVDEPNDAKDWRTVAARLEYRLTKEAVPSARTFCTAYSLDAMKRLEPWLDVRTVPINQLAKDAPSNQAYHDYQRRAGGEIWGIEWPAMWDDFFRARQLGGFGPAKADIACMTAWTYYNPSPWTDEYNDLRGPTKRCLLVYRDADGGLIPTLPWEGIRAGITDRRYLTTLEQAVAKAEGSKRQRGTDALREILASIPWLADPQAGWGNRRATQLRARIAEAILELGK